MVSFLALEGLEPNFQQVSWLPDGSRLAFSRWAGNRPHFGVVNTDGTDYSVRRDNIYGGICCSPTAALVAATSSKTLVFYWVDTDTSIEIPLESIAGNMGTQNMAWSPDGAFIALAAEGRKQRRQGESEQNALVVLTQKGDIIREIHGYNIFSDVSWGADSRTLAAHSGNYDGTRMVDVRSGETLRDISNGSSLRMNPKHQTVSAYLRRVDARYTLLIEGRKKDLILGHFNYDREEMFPPRHISWSPDGTKLLFDGISRNGLRGITRMWYVYDLSTKLPQPIGVAGGWDHLGLPAWGPDSKQIAFIKSGQVVICTL